VLFIGEEPTVKGGIYNENDNTTAAAAAAARTQIKTESIFCHS
jgi:hypothetical protein